ncbi:MAG TPA: OsmC family peroxiredoxin [Solirubrobacteraceae bacterium]|nr:OsmC family peroxiredoxin [Solirubrobacteraceae bacterium]
MAIATRQADVSWEGSLAAGEGAISSASGAFDRLPVTWASRTQQPEGRTSPEELIAAAHASCFAMALALVLGRSDAPPGQLAVSARCTLDEIDGAPRITAIDLAVGARLGGIGKEQFERCLSEAAQLCPVSNALRGAVQINVSGELEPLAAAH